MFSPSGPGTRSLRAGRHSQENAIYFITAVTRDRIPWFQQFDLAQVISVELHNPNTWQDSENLCWVVMPDHIHFLLRLGITPLGKILSRFKSGTARKLNNKIGRSGPFWDAGYYDHALREEENMVHIARYIVANPKRAGLVDRCGDYPFWNTIWL